MKVIFIQNVKSAGKKDEVKDVNEGYARNFLIPNKLAVEASARALGELKKKQEDKNSKEAKWNKEFSAAVEKLETFELVIKKKANAEGHLFSSVPLKDIVAELNEKGISLHLDDFELYNPIKKVGKGELSLKRAPGKSLKISIENE